LLRKTVYRTVAEIQDTTHLKKKSHQMRNYLPGVAVALITGMFLIAGCQASAELETVKVGSNVADANVIRISSREMEQIPADGRLVLRTNNEDDVLVFDASLVQSDFERMDIVCPNGRQMSMMAWLSELAAGQSVDIAALIGSRFTVSRNQQYAKAIFEESMDKSSGSLGSHAEASICSDKGEICTLDDGVIVCYCVE
jgi:hypothetical protein